MGVRILHDGQQNLAALYDSVTGTAFGPVFNESDDGEHPIALAESFITCVWESTEMDPRSLKPSELEQVLTMWQEQRKARKDSENGCTCPGSIRETGRHSQGCPALGKR